MAAQGERPAVGRSPIEELLLDLWPTQGRGPGGADPDPRGGKTRLQDDPRLLTPTGLPLEELDLLDAFLASQGLSLAEWVMEAETLLQGDQRVRDPRVVQPVRFNGPRRTGW